MIEAYIIHLLVLVAIYAILAVSLNLALGFTGMLNLGHIAFFGIGAYTSTLLVKAGVPFLAAFVIAGLVAATFGYVLVFATRKLKGDYLALATLGFSYAIYTVLMNWISLTKGPLGLAGIPKPNIFGLAITTPLGSLIITAVFAAIAILIMYTITESGFGRLMQACRDDELCLKAMGKNTFKIKYKAMMISAFFAGIAGSLFAHYISFIDPASFILPEILLIFTIVIVGGLASVRGSIIGAIVIIMLPEALRFFQIASTAIGPLRQIVYALILLLILQFRPKGIFGKVDLE